MLLVCAWLGSKWRHVALLLAHVLHQTSNLWSCCVHIVVVTQASRGW
jgi:hypothetical protein